MHAGRHAHAPAEAAHHPALQHHFESMQQQKEASMLGMWTFLLTEILFFGGLFMAYMLYRTWYHDAFVAASTSLSIFWGGLNTVVLIGSSLTMALAVRASQLNQRKPLIGYLIATMILGTVFLGVKVIEYADKFEHHHVPGANFVWESHAAGGEGGAATAGVTHEGGGAPAPAGEQHQAGSLGGTHQPASRPEFQQWTQIYFSLYFTMTGLHALHMIVGLGLMSVITFMAWRGKFDEHYYTPVEMSGLYWHFVDIVWIYLFPLLYLIDRS